MNSDDRFSWVIARIEGRPQRKPSVSTTSSTSTIQSTSPHREGVASRYKGSGMAHGWRKEVDRERVQ